MLHNCSVSETSVRLRPDGRRRSRPAAADADARLRRRLVERQAADRRRGVVLHARLALLATAPVRRDEPARFAEVLDQLGVAGGVANRAAFALVAGGLEERPLDG